MTGLLLHLYPASWRSRYGDEFAALLEERPLGPFDVADVVLGAIDARLHLRGREAPSQAPKGLAMTLRIGGYAAILGSLLWIVGLGTASGETAFVAPGSAVMILGNVALLVALVGLSAFQSRRYPRLAWASFALPFVGSIVTIVGALTGMGITPASISFGGLTAWELWATGMLALVGGSGLFAVVSWRAGTLSRPGVALLAVAAVALLVAIPGAAGLVPWEPLVSIAMFLTLGGFVAGWVVVGIGAVRADRISLSSLPG
jgi:hypothetical protein